MSAIKNFFKNNGFITDDEPATENKPVSVATTFVKQPAQPSKIQPVTSSQPNTQSFGVVSKEKEEKAAKYFTDLLDQANLPGPDFFEYLKALKQNKEALGSSITDESIIYKMVFTTLQTSGLKMEVLESSSAEYLKLLDQHYADFSENNNKVVEQKVGSKEKRITDLNASIASKLEEIKNLNDDIILAKQEIESVGSEITIEKSKIEETVKAFELAYTKTKNEIIEVMGKCKSFLTTK